MRACLADHAHAETAANPAVYTNGLRIRGHRTRGALRPPLSVGFPNSAEGHAFDLRDGRVAYLRSLQLDAAFPGLQVGISPLPRRGAHQTAVARVHQGGLRVGFSFDPLLGVHRRNRAWNRLVNTLKVRRIYHLSWFFQAHTLVVFSPERVFN